MFDTTKLPEEIKIGSTLDDKKLMHLFTHFLKSNNCYIEYRTNQVNHPHCSNAKRNYFYNFKVGDKEIVCYTQNGLASEIINFAFTWADTKQGHRYWQDLHSDWKHIIKNYKLELKNFF